MVVALRLVYAMLHEAYQAALTALLPLPDRHWQPDSAVIYLVDQLIETAVSKKASDIHFEPQASLCRIRFRCQGLLETIITLPLALYLRVISRLKILAQLNIAEHRIPQDGQFTIISIPNKQFRINTLPSLFGEKIALRILDTNESLLTLSQLGLTPSQLTCFTHHLSQPQGLILVTGPTGSGKTSTLYAALNHLNTPDINIMTIEDPIEITLPGISQTAIQPGLQLDFHHLLKSLLRQDPDVLMIGEIRDQETAITAMQAAETGHLVLSTLHTQRAQDAIPRLQSLGINSAHLLQTVSLVIAQRLVRRLDQGQIAIFELFTPTHPEACTSLSHQARALISEGITTPQEIKRVLGHEA